MPKFLGIIAILLLVGSPIASAADSPASKLVKIRNGINSVDFTGDGIPDLVITGHRDNFNAHSFDVVSFYIFVPPKDGNPGQWDIVPVMKNDDEQFEITVGGGADCILHDFRLLTGAGKNPTSLILADRDLGESFADSRTVTFTYFTLETNDEGIPGFPRYSLKKSRVVKSKSKYCDVGEAFLKELGIGSYAP